MKKAFIGAFGLAIALVLAGCTLFYPNSGSPEDFIEPSTSSSSASSSEDPAEESSTEQSSSPSPSPSVSPTMAPAQLQIVYTDTSAGQLMVVAEVTNFAEDGGRCTLSYYKGTTATVVGTVKAERNITSTQCYTFNVDFSALPKGALELTVSYSSENHIGESAKFEVTIP